MFDLIPFDRKQHDLFDYFDRFEKSFFDGIGKEVSAFRTDIMEKDDRYVLQAELPGFRKEDIKISIDGSNLTIRAEHNEEKEEKDEKKNFIRRERRYGSFARNFDITGIQADGISAQYDNGILELNLPKEEPKKLESRSIEIK